MMMKKLSFLVFTLLTGMTLTAQEYNNPHIAIKPIPTLSIPQVVINDTATIVKIQIVNSKQLPPFTLRTRELYIRPVSDPNSLNLVKAINAPFAPEKHVFTTQNEVFDFTLIFPPLPKGTKYFDLMENMPERQFYVQGIILDPQLNALVQEGFDAFSRADGNAALKAFIAFANADLYFEYGLAYFNIIYLLTASNRIDEAQVWYDKFKEHFFYDKKLLQTQMDKLGISQKLK
jgi:hypothetical protein